jgi:tight adherence protein B
MQDLIFPIVIALAVASAVWGVAQLVTHRLSGEKKRLKHRLSIEHSGAREASVHRTILIQSETKGLSAVLARQRIFNGLYCALLQTWPEMPLTRFIGITLGSGVMMFVVLGAMFNSAPMGGVAALLGMYVPFLALTAKRNRRQQALANQLPDALDFLSRILRAGHSLSTGLHMMGEELPKPLATEFRKCYAQHSLGQSLEDALKEMSGKIESTDFAFFVTAVLIQRQTGGDLSEVLNNISGMIRQRIRLQQHVKAKTAEGRFTGYILVAMPALLFMIAYYLNPEYSGTLLHTSTGLKMLGVSFVLQVLGLLAIRKLTTVKV